MRSPTGYDRVAARARRHAAPASRGGARRPARRRDAGVVVVPDRHGTGTNALVLSPPDAIEPSFGPDSLARHVAAAEAAGVPSGSRRCPALALDVDTPDDLASSSPSSSCAAAGADHARRAPSARPRGRVARSRAAGVGLSSFSVSALAAAAADPAGRRPRRADRRGRARRSRRTGTSWSWRTRWCRRRRAACAAWARSSRASARARSPPSTARTAARPGRARRVRRAAPRRATARSICVTRHGFVCANAGVDQSNASGEGGEVVLLPEDPDASAAALRAGIEARARRAARPS